MKTTLTHYETLIFYDIPQLFIARDNVGSKYICLLSEQFDNYDIVLCTPVSVSRLNMFLLGSVDLIEIFTKPEVDFIYKANISSFDSQHFDATPLTISDIQQNWLPDEGFFFNDYEPSQDKVLNDSKEKSRGIVYMHLNNEETKYNSIISASKLADSLISFQSVVKYAYKKGISKLSNKKKKLLNKSDNYSLDAFAFSSGSFKVKLQSQALSNLFGESELSRALTIIDELVQNIEDVDKSLKLLTEHKGHLANTYMKLLKNIATSNTGLTYRWGTSASKESIVQSISQSQASELYNIFNQREELKEESVELVGIIDKVDNTYGTWRLIDSEGVKHTGELAKIDGLSLTGIIITKQQYKFSCIEKIVEILGTGEEKISLQLESYEKTPT